MKLKEGDLVKVNKKRVKKIAGHYWHDIRIKYLSTCGRYCRIEGRISYGKGIHSAFTEIENLIKIEGLDMKLKPLVLNLQGVHWRLINDGKKLFEFRLINDYWKKRLVGKQFSCIELRLGYPSRSDHQKIMRRQWNGFFTMNMIHPFFGPDPVDVFAIDVTTPLIDPIGF